MAFFKEFFGIKEEPGILTQRNIQVNDIKVDSSLIRKRKFVAAIIEEIETKPIIFSDNGLDYCINNEPTIFLERLENVPFNKLEQTIKKEDLKKMDLLSCIIHWKNIISAYYEGEALENAVLKIMKSISQKYGGVKLPKEPYLARMFMSNFSIERIIEALQYCDVNAIIPHEGNLLFYIQQQRHFDLIYQKIKDQINHAQVDEKGVNFIQQYVVTPFHGLTSTSFIKQLGEFAKKGLNYNQINTYGYNTLTWAIYYNNIEFIAVLSNLNFIDFTINRDSKNWFQMLVTKNFNINDQITILKNIHQMGKLEPKFLVTFFDITFPITRYDEFHNNILNLIESFILNSDEAKYKQFFEYADDNGNTIVHRLAKSNHIKTLRFIMEHTHIKFTKNKLGEYPIDVYKANRIEQLLEKNNDQNQGGSMDLLL